ncbi:N-acetylmuramoyl-L-alanine amidase [Terasakiella sp. SH-1]|uniref:N-acetylmuramoyl-L-alanine amidase n=1 Tax=Terasakiella sp. SH-1 TaxID=2560057 RepID=UPI00107420C8|nr:N-acetylmuramoyl-L-alanine amidase [Terasakiella sp. SH-1]
MPVRERTDFIIIHCSATKADMDIDAQTIRDWHVNENGWADIGYNRVIKRDGTIEQGRHDDAIGAHARGYNDKSIGICLVGGLGPDGQAQSNFTFAQYAALANLLEEMKGQYPQAKIIGHCDVANKACPSFDVKSLVGV